MSDARRDGFELFRQLSSSPNFNDDKWGNPVYHWLPWNTPEYWAMRVGLHRKTLYMYRRDRWFFPPYRDGS